MAMLASREFRTFMFSKRVSLSILTGLLLGTSYIPFPPWALFFYLVPLWIVWFEEKSLRGIFWTGCLAQFVFNLIGFNWVGYTVHEFGHLPWPLAFAVLCLFCLAANLFLPFTGLIWFVLCKKMSLDPIRKIWLLPVLVAIGERVSPMIFDWNEGYCWLWWRFPAYHLADIIGFLGLASVSIAFNAMFLMAWWRRQNGQRWWPWAFAVPAIFALMNLAGHFHGSNLAEPDAHLKFLLLQANIGNQEKLMSEKGGAYRDVVISRWVNLTYKGLQAAPADFAVWPETAFPESIDDPTLSGMFPMKLKTFVAGSHTRLITGGYSHLVEDGRYTNSFFILGPDGNWAAPPYHKTVLLAFGEYFPLGDQFPWLKRMFPEVGDYGRGPGPTVLDGGGVKIGAQICYEGLFDWFTRDLANKGAEIIVNVTNDSWYGKWEQPYQHGWMTFARAVEVRRPLVRSTNTGFSTVALASGEIMELSPLHEEWFHLYDVPYNTKPAATIFMSWGYWIFRILFFIALLWIFLGTRSKRQQ